MSRLPLLPILLTFLLIGCAAPIETTLTVTITVDGGSQTVLTTPDSVVNDVLRQAGITLNDLDRVNPPGFTRVTDGMVITIVRVAEEIVIEQETIPFERLSTLNDGLPPGETRLLQAGVNGVAEVTYRISYEDDVETSRSEIRRVVITPPQDEVIMVGSQNQLPPVAIHGTVAYISGGNAWIMRESSADRRPLTLDGGLDGRVFALSADGQRLLFTRGAVSPQSTEPASGLVTPTPQPTSVATGDFNTLWVILDTTDPESEPVRLNLSNILYVDWVPGEDALIVYSTAEPRPNFPGWQANNDLWRAQVRANGVVRNHQLLVEPSSGGLYGWFGTLFSFAPDGSMLAWAQPDAVGVLRPPEEASSQSLPDSYEWVTLAAFPPRDAVDVVWVPGLAWSPDGNLIATTTHGAPLGAETPEDSPVFNLTVLPARGGYTVDLVAQVGMWSSPQFSPASTPDGTELEVRLAYLQAIQPLDSYNSRYQLVIVDRDGSNRRVLFPPDGEPGLAAQTIAWSPDGSQIALVYQTSLYLVDVLTGLAQQVTIGGPTSSPRWTP